MHTPEIRQKFIELRADAHSIPKIASLLGVAQSTLRLWEKDDALEIAHLRCSYWQDAEDKVGITIEHRLRRMAEWIKGAEDELEKRHFELMNNRDLMRFLREARREYFRLRAMLFNAPGVKTREHTPRTRNTPAAPANAEGGRDAAPSASAVDPVDAPIPSATAETPAANPSDKIDKVGELADFPETQPRNTNDLQQPNSSSADFQNTTTSNSVTPEVTRGLTPSDPPANPEPSSAYAGSDSQTPQPGQPQGDSTTPSIPKSSNPFFYYSPENLFVPSTPFHAGEPIRIFLARCREADLSAAQLRPAAVDDLPPTNTPLQRGGPAQPYDSPTASAVLPCDDLPPSNSLSPQRAGMALCSDLFCPSMRIVHLRSSSDTV